MHTLKEDERRTFNEWWNEGEVSGNNPYRHESAGWWAWEGWQAGTKAEREACALVAENEHRSWPPFCGIDGGEIVANDIAAAIRARGQE